jgi:hypothetical protein
VAGTCGQGKPNEDSGSRKGEEFLDRVSIINNNTHSVKKLWNSASCNLVTYMVNSVGIQTISVRSIISIETRIILIVVVFLRSFHPEQAIKQERSGSQIFMIFIKSNSPSFCTQKQKFLPNGQSIFGCQGAAYPQHSLLCLRLCVVSNHFEIWENIQF